VMTVPLIILAILSAIGGFIGFPHYLGLPNGLDNWLEPVFRNANVITESYRHTEEHSIAVELIFVLISVVVAVAAIMFAFRKFSAKETFKEEKGFGKILENKYYLDEIYEAGVVKPIQVTSDKILWGFFDIKIIDGAVNGIALYFSKLSVEWRKLQSGVIQDYATVTIAGIVLILLFVLFM
jgi:NADH-quinone oxidoreductase subunit L